jgi:adenosylmethionine-8-amino-7-oxononanoate aminotransferase
MRAPSFSEPGALRTAAQMVHEHHRKLAAVVVEPLVQGAAGMLIAPAEDFSALAKACRETGVLLICDEVATGFGRTGTLFASERCGLRPDVLCLGKGITGGYLPMSATVASQRVFAAFLGPDLSEKTLYHGHSYGGNALAAAVALKHLELMGSLRVLDNVRERSTQLRAALEKHIRPFERVKDIRLAGLMGAVELNTSDDPKLARRTSAAMVKRGVLSRSMGPVITIVPPLTITAAEIDRIVTTLAAALQETTRETT